MSYPTRRQFAALAQSSLTSAAKTYTFSQAALAGDLLVITYAGDKNTGTITVTDNIGNNGGANPWTVEVSVPGASVSTYIAWKVAVGGETVITATVSAAPATGSTGYAEEMVDDGSGVWMVVAKANPAYSDTSRASAASGTTDTADYDGRALAVGTIDSMSSIGTEAQRTLPSFTNFTKIFDPDWPSGSGGGSGGCYVGSLNLAAGATTSTTFATNGGSDQLHCAIVAFGKVETAANPPVVSAGADTSVEAGATFSRTGTNTGGAITSHEWKIQSGPTGAGNVLATTAALSWIAPSTTGAYTLRYTGTNADGSSFDDVVVTVTAPTGGGGDIAVRARSAPAMRAEANSHTLSTPAATVAGDSIYIWTSTDEVTATDGAIPSIGATSVTAGWQTDPAWTMEQSTSTNVRGSLFYLPSAVGGGADQLVINFPAGVTEPCAYTVIVVANGGTPVVGTLTSVGGTTNTTHTPSAISGLDSAKKYLSLLFIAIDDSSTTVQHNVTAPANYTNVQESETPAPEANAVMAASMERLLAAGVTSITPGAITWTNGDQSIATHVAIPEGVTAPDLDPMDIIPFGNADGQVHYAFDIGQEADGGRTLYYPSTIAGGLELDPEFLGTSDGWLQTAARADATTTSPSTNNARSEGRETTPGADSNLGWNPVDNGTHWQRFRARVMEHPLANNVGIATGQIHSLDDDTVMVRTRVVSGVNTLVLRTYDPGTNNTIDRVTLDSDYQFGEIYDILLMVHKNQVYIFYQDFTQYVYKFAASILPVTGTYMLKWGNYNQFYEGTSGVNATDWGRTHYKNVAHWHTGWAAPSNYFNAPTVDAGADVASHPAGSTLARTATDSDPSGLGITQRQWTILDGPTGSGTIIGTAAALSWAPTTQGTYELMYGAKNANGWSNPEFLTVTVTAPVGPEAGRMLLAVS